MGGPEQDETAAWLVAWLDQHGLEATPAMRGRYRLEGTAPATGSSLEAERELAPLLASLLPSLPLSTALSRERIFAGVSKELCRRALRKKEWQLGENDVAFEHGEVFRAAALAWRKLEQPEGIFEAAMLASQALFLDGDHHLLTPDLESELRSAVEEGWSRLPPSDLPLAEAPKLCESVEGPLVVLLVDALRWDLYLHWRPWLCGRLGEPWLERRVSAALPTVTRQARSALLGGEEFAPAGSDGLFMGRSVRMVKTAERKPAECDQALREPFEAVWLHLGFVDRRAHASELELWPLFRELTLEAHSRMGEMLAKLPSNANLLLAADHGFLSAEERSHQHAHGGGTAQERLVPWVLWRRATR